MYQERSVSLLEEDLEEELVEDQVALEELVVLGVLEELVGKVVLEVDMVDLEEEVAVEAAMEVVELELEDLLIIERMTLDKMRRISRSVKQNESKVLNPDHSMKPSFSLNMVRTN